MALLEQWELDEFRADAVTDFLPDLCNIYTPAASAPYEGEDSTVVIYPTGWTAIASNIPCRLTLKSTSGGSEQMEIAGVKATASYTIHLGYAASSALVIDKRSRVRVTTQGNRDFEVMGVPDVTERITRILEAEERT